MGTADRHIEPPKHSEYRSLNLRLGKGRRMSQAPKKNVRQDVITLKGHNVLSNSKTKMLPYVVAYLEPF